MCALTNPLQIMLYRKCKPKSSLFYDFYLTLHFSFGSVASKSYKLLLRWLLPHLSYWKHRFFSAAFGKPHGVREQKGSKNPILDVLHLLFLQPWRVPSYIFYFYCPFPIVLVQLCVMRAKLEISVCICANKGFLELISEENLGLFLYFFF